MSLLIPTQIVSPSNVTKILAITAGSQAPDPDRTIRKERTEAYSGYLWFFVLSFICLVTIINLINYAYRLYLSRRRTQIQQHREEREYRGSVDLRRLPAALLNTCRALSFRWTIQIGHHYSLNLMEVLLTMVYITLCLTLDLINTTSTKGLLFDPKYYANRATSIASAQLPLVTALGMKNNIISFLTGVSYDKLLYLHRMTSRVLVVLIWLHAAGRADLGFEGTVAVTVPQIQAGILAGSSLTLLAILSVRPIRQRAYELFLVAHFILAFIVLLSAYFHVASLGFGRHIWPSFLLWGIDRGIRVIRTLALSFTSSKSNSSDDGTTSRSLVAIRKKAHISMIGKDFVSLNIPCPPHFHWRPGQGVYLTFPSLSPTFYPFEAHPFTIAAIDTHIDSGAINSNSNLDDRSSTSDEKESEKVEQSVIADKQLKFFIRVRGGMTTRLLTHAEGNQLDVMIDGPYSTPPVLDDYNSVVLISGGSGVTFTLPLFLDLIMKSKKPRTPQRITFIWAIRTTEPMVWIQKELFSVLKNLPPNSSIQVCIFVTGQPKNTADLEQSSTTEDEKSLSLDDPWQSAEKQSSTDDSNSAEGSSNIKSTVRDHKLKEFLALPMVQVRRGRPDLECLIKDEIRVSRGTMSVNVCGIRSLAENVRKAIRSPRMGDILRGGPSISLHVEAFGA